MHSSSSSLSNTKKQTKIYMEYSRPDQWLKHVVPKDREWEAISESKRRHNNGDGGVLFLSEEKKLELRLGPPGEDPKSLYSSSSVAAHGDGGAKRGYEEGTFVEAKPWPPPPAATATADCTFTLPSSYSSPSALVLENQQQQPKPSYPVLFDSFSKPFPCPSTHDQLQLLQYYKDKMPSSASAANANTAVPNTSHSHKRIEHAPIVGWPPVRSFRRKNLVKYKYSGPSSWKAASESSNKIIPKETSGGYEKSEGSKPGLFVKINMDGVPFGRKVDLKACDSYEKLSYAVNDLFGALLSAAQKETSPADTGDKLNKMEEAGLLLLLLLDGSGEYTLVYEDNEGDRMLVGDVPWHMFVSTVKRLCVLKRSELTCHPKCEQQQQAIREATTPWFCS